MSQQLARGVRPTLRPALLAASVLALAALTAASLAVGSKHIPINEVIQALTGNATGELDAIVRGSRLPRTLLGVLAGLSFGLAGALMQGLTRNPLADPGILGVSAGAGFAVAISVLALGVTDFYGYIWFAFLGALITTILVYALGSAGRGGATPVKLALAGVAVLALLTSLTSGILMLNSNSLNVYRFWAVGSLTGHDTAVLLKVLPFIAVGTLLALSAAPTLNTLALGDDLATALGRRLGWVRAQSVIAVTLLAGAAAAAVGPIVFIGLLVPHLARAITGPDYRWILPFTLVLSPCLVLAADILGRLVARPQEVGVGAIAAFIGAPIFIALIRRRRLAEL